MVCKLNKQTFMSAQWVPNSYGLHLSKTLSKLQLLCQTNSIWIKIDNNDNNMTKIAKIKDILFKYNS